MSTPLLPAAPTPLARFLRNDFLVAAVIAVVLSGLTFALAYSFGWLTEAPNWFEVAGATINYGATYLSIKQRRFAYTLGFVASAAFAVAYFQYGLLASALLSGYLVGQLIYGYFRWGPDSASRPVHKFQIKWWWAYALATVLTYLGAVGIVTLFGGQFAFWDAAILILTILAQFLLDNKVISAWYVWGAVNIVGVILYFTAGAPFAAVQQLIFLFANIPGYILWKRSMEAAGSQTLEEGPEAVDTTAPKALAFIDETDEKFTPTFNPDSKIILQTGHMPIIRDGEPVWRRLVEPPEQYSGDSKVEATYHPHTHEVNIQKEN